MGGPFTVEDLEVVTASVTQAWTAGADRDWNAQAGTLDWTCSFTANHAVDTVVAPAFFLASRRTDHYPEGGGWSPGETAKPTDYIDGLGLAMELIRFDGQVRCADYAA